MSRTSILSFLLLVAVCNFATAQITGSVNSDGKVVLSGDNVPVLGVELKSAGGFLIPVDTNLAAPFEFFLRNTPEQIIYGSLVNEVVIDGDLVLSAGYANPGGFEGDLIGQWGGPEIVGAVSDGPIRFVPEPSAGGMLLFAAIVFSRFRGKRKT